LQILSKKELTAESLASLLRSGPGIGELSL